MKEWDVYTAELCIGRIRGTEIKSRKGVFQVQGSVDVNKKTFKAMGLKGKKPGEDLSGMTMRNLGRGWVPSAEDAKKFTFQEAGR